MNLPFPKLTPRLIDSKWFSSDSPCDEEAELAAMEKANLHWLNSIGQQYMKRIPLGKADPEPMEEEADTDEEGNEESDESEESHDEDEEDVPTAYSTTRNNNEIEPDSLDDLNEAPDLNTSDQSSLWPLP